MKNNSITHNGVEYISAKDAAYATGYARDYISRLCRQEKIAGYLLGKSWYVDLASLQKFQVAAKIVAQTRNDQLSREIRQNLNTQKGSSLTPHTDAIEERPGRHDAHHVSVMRAFTTALDKHEQMVEARHPVFVYENIKSRSGYTSAVRDYRDRAVALALALGFAFSALSALNPSGAVRALNDFNETKNSSIAFAYTLPESIVNATSAMSTLASSIDPAATLNAAAAPLADSDRERVQMAAAGAMNFFEIFRDTAKNVFVAVRGAVTFGDRATTTVNTPSTPSRTTPTISIDYSFIIPSDATMRLSQATAAAQSKNTGNASFSQTILTNGADDYIALNHLDITSYLGKAIQEIATISVAFKNNLVARFDDAANEVQEPFAHTTHQEILCVGTDEDETCITKDELDELLVGAAIAVPPPPPDNTPPSSSTSDAPKERVYRLSEAEEEPEADSSEPPSTP